MATYGQDGKKEAEVRFPYSMRFKPGQRLHDEFADEYHGTFTDDFEKITPGELLYEVFATDQPKELGGVEQKIGELITDGYFTTSKWADSHFFIRHQDMHDDLAIYPNWSQYTPQFSWTEGQDGVGEIMGKKARALAAGCPFAAFLQ